MVAEEPEFYSVRLSHDFKSTCSALCIIYTLIRSGKGISTLKKITYPKRHVLECNYLQLKSRKKKEKKVAILIMENSTKLYKVHLNLSIERKKKLLTYCNH